MVATKIHEVAGKGLEWAYGGSSSTTGAGHVIGTTSSSTPAKPTASSGSIPSVSISASDSSPAILSSKASTSEYYWNYASEAAESTYSTVTGAFSSIPFWKDENYSSESASTTHPSKTVMTNLPPPSVDGSNSSPNIKSFLKKPDLISMLNYNPYIGVRGGRHNYPARPSSMNAVRMLLSVVPLDASTTKFDLDLVSIPSHGDSIHSDGGIGGVGGQDTPIPAPTPSSSKRFSMAAIAAASSTPSETASQLAEGTVRAFRDIALDEAVELHDALRYWSYRWERPLLSWLEAGPTVWFSEAGYRHQAVGEKVSQIQAVLARRCASIGDLQEHLLRAGWQRGVSQWGFLGDGGEWAAVAGFDDDMHQRQSPRMQQCPPSLPTPTAFRRAESELSDIHVPSMPIRSGDSSLGPSSNVSKLPQRSHHASLYYADLFVKQNHGGKIAVDSSALAEWSMHAMSIVRRQLHRASNGMVPLPFTENWPSGDEASLDQNPPPLPMDDEDDLEHADAGSVAFPGATPRCPIWASLMPDLSPVDESQEDEPELQRTEADRVKICDLPLMAAEVSELLNVMEVVMQIQRDRRLKKLKSPTWLRRNWYMLSITVPSIGYLVYKLARKKIGWVYVRYAANQMVSFFREHVSEPLNAIYTELFRGTDNISDREARNVTISNLKVMIKAWLDENYPDMPVADRERMAERMDMSLIDSKKAISVNSIYEINHVIRMSFIEAQFIKKEMMNAMLALDEMQSSNNINMNLAAVTPALMMLYSVKRAFQFVFYATFKLGKSREETYAMFRHVLTEVERLLVMRDNPPKPPVLSGEESTFHLRRHVEDASRQSLVTPHDNVLNTDDLGMLMLHIHELRTILWRDRNRFSWSTIRSVAEDLAEIAGERGAVSVRQQLQIVSRMCRNYVFLKIGNETYLEVGRG